MTVSLHPQALRNQTVIFHPLGNDAISYFWKYILLQFSKTNKRRGTIHLKVVHILHSTDEMWSNVHIFQVFLRSWEEKNNLQG